MKIKLTTKSNRSFKLKRLLPWLPAVTFIIFLILLGALIYFLYHNFYQTIAQIKIVHILRAQVALTRVDTSLYHNIYTAWENKKKIDPIINLVVNDPFRSLGAVPSSNITENLNQANQIMP